MRKENILKFFLLVLNILIFIRLFYVAIIRHDYYFAENKKVTDTIYYGSSAPRGRILDTNGKILVDNKGIKVLTYKKEGNIDIHNMCVELAKILEFKSIDVQPNDLKSYYYFVHKKEIDQLLDNKMLDKYNSKLISKNELEDYKYSFIRDEELANVNDHEAYIYKLINTGYSFSDKIIKNDISEEELIKINNLNIKGLNIGINWVRVYNYDTVINDLFGTIGPITKENVKWYLENGYSLDDTVGTTFLEKYYEPYLKGTKEAYKFSLEGEKILLQEERRGNDLVLSIDIDKQLEIEKALKEETLNVKKYPSSKYYKGTYVISSNPQTGGIIAIAGFSADDIVKNDVIGTITNSYAVGSVVKGASQSVAFINGAINTSKKVLDSCVKLKNQPSKCSWTRLGYISDIDALRQSSNYYQFINAIKVSGYEYSYNMSFNPTIDDFNKYRSVFKNYGLGSLTGIDLSEEKLGITGSTISGDLLLNLAIGQYDTYTPIMVNSYINTIANNGIRNKLRLVDYAISTSGDKLEINPVTMVDKVEINESDLKRVQAGLKAVINAGTGRGYVDSDIDAAGKTGTSETFYNGIPTTTKSFIMYAPFDNPTVSVTIISPNLVYKNSINNYSYPINSRISRKIANILFEK